MTAASALARGWIAPAESLADARSGPVLLPALITRLERRLPPRRAAGSLGTPGSGSPSSAGGRCPPT